jgi:hypothetical protein
MSPNHPPTIDLDALQESLADRVPSQGDGDLAAHAIETAANCNGQSGQDNQRADAERSGESQAISPVPRLGAEAAANMTKLSNAAAGDIRRLGHLAFDAGKRAQEECEQMARDVEANGGTVALHLAGLSQLLADVGMSNRETLHRLLAGVSPSIVPRADHIDHRRDDPPDPGCAPLVGSPNDSDDKRETGLV